MANGMTALHVEMPNFEALAASPMFGSSGCEASAGESPSPS